MEPGHHREISTSYVERQNLTMRKDPYPRTPAMAAGAADHVWTLADIARLADLETEVLRSCRVPVLATNLLHVALAHPALAGDIT